MTSILSPTPTSLPKTLSVPCFSSLVPNSLPTCTTSRRIIPTKCKAFFGEIPVDLFQNAFHVDDSNPVFPFLQYGLTQFEQFTAGWPENERWGILTAIGLSWVYLTVRPGVLMGAIDTYILAPLQLGFDSLIGRRNLKMNDFVVGERLGEGSFGVVYAGAIVPKNFPVEERLGKGGRSVDIVDRFNERVILKKVKLGIKGAEEFGDYEEWFNYRVSRAAPESCADFLGSFVADKTRREFTKGGKWLVWKFELNSPDLFDMYSAGIVLMQMAVPSLRSSAALKNFNLELKTVGYNLNAWRERARSRPDLRILDLDSGRGWDLATKLVSKRNFLRRGRLSAAAALRHPYFLWGGDRAAAVLSKLSLNK